MKIVRIGNYELRPENDPSAFGLVRNVSSQEEIVFVNRQFAENWVAERTDPDGYADRYKRDASRGRL